MIVHIIGAALLLASGASSANPGYPVPEVTANQEPAEQLVEVAGVRNPEWKPYRTLLLGFDAFESKRELAPGAALRFALRPLNPATSMAGVTMRLQSKTQSTPVQLDENNSFTLPRDQIAADDGAELLINRRKNTMTIRPDIRTPGLPANVRRLGDLRLECHVRWEIHKDELSFVKRNAFRMLGGPCGTGTVKTYYIADRPINGAWLTAPGRKVALEINGNGALFRPPLHDASWSDEALVVLDFADASRTVAQGDRVPLAVAKHEK